MTEAACPRCAGTVAVPTDIASRDQVIVLCAHCGAQIRISRSQQAVEETIALPQPLSEETSSKLPAGEGGEAIQDRSGTDPLGSEDTVSAKRPVQLAVRRYLILVGAMPGDEQLPLAGERTVVGRKAADIIIDDPSLSSRHFEVEARGKETFVRDLESRNGTLLNGQRIRSAQLTSGDTIQAGQSKFIFRAKEVIPWDRSE